jgi:hypothetical protein
VKTIYHIYGPIHVIPSDAEVVLEVTSAYLSDMNVLRALPANVADDLAIALVQATGVQPGDGHLIELWLGAGAYISDQDCIRLALALIRSVK